jgi:hypothetical protein
MCAIKNSSRQSNTSVAAREIALKQQKLGNANEDGNLTAANLSILKMLFEEHHRQLTNKRQKIHSTTEKTLAIFLIIAGWPMLAKNPMAPSLRWVLISVALLIFLTASGHIYVNNHSYFAIARVVGRVNVALGLYEKGKFPGGEALYSKEWKSFGIKGEFRGALSHILAILAGLLLCFFAVSLSA